MVNQEPLEVILITGRTIEQGCSLEGGKMTDEFIKATGICELDPDDMKKLKIKPGNNLKVKTDFGEVVVSAIKSPHEPHPGIIFIPMGLWASQVMDPNSDNTGMPTMKGLKATVDATEEEVLDVKAILEKIRES